MYGQGLVLGVNGRVYGLRLQSMAKTHHSEIAINEKIFQKHRWRDGKAIIADFSLNKVHSFDEAVVARVFAYWKCETNI